jgi:cytochrome c oxidase assembly protein subunit 15
MLWISLQLFDMPKENHQIRNLKPFMLAIMVLLFIQLCYGSLMAGTHAALSFPTFPKFGDKWIPENLFSLSPFFSNFFQNTATIQFIHRSLGMLIVVMAFIFLIRTKDKPMTNFFRKAYATFPVVAFIQMIIGALILLNSLGSIPIIYGVAHQLNAVLLLMTSIVLLYQVSNAKNFQEASAIE